MTHLVTINIFLLCVQEMIQLEGIPNLSGLVQSFDQQQLANFCRILSVTISEPDVGNDDKHTLLAKNAQQKKNNSPSRAEVNQGRCPRRPPSAHTTGHECGGGVVMQIKGCSGAFHRTSCPFIIIQ